MEDIEASELAQIIADALKAKGLQAQTQGNGAGGRFARLAVRTTAGQVFTIQLEEE